MTDDLVKRLREYRVGCGLHCEAHDAQEPLSECIEAAHRIEKLECEITSNAIHLDVAMVCMLNNQTRIEKLEEALREIAYTEPEDKYWPGRIARKALEGKDD